MCGFSGLVSDDPAFGAEAVRRMTATMVRRGPDDEGFWSSSDGRVQLGFRRLSVVDTTPAGHQPMVSADGGGVLVFNGEIYNHRELRQSLERRGAVLRSQSDSEVLLELLRRDGRAGLARLNGMFALAYVDIASGSTLLARDHLGIKPLHVATEPGGPGFAFASRYDALFHTGWLDLDAIVPESITAYLAAGRVVAPFGLHRGAFQVPPGGWVEIDAAGRRRSGTWWQAEVPDDGLITDFSSAVDATKAAIESAVARQRLADVPVGTFLSSGIDSPTVAAAMTALAGPGLPAYTLTTPGWVYDEGPVAAELARTLGLDHHLIEADELRDDGLVSDLVLAAGEPIDVCTLLPTHLVARRAREQVTVLLGGDGGDELFMGYPQSASLADPGLWWNAPWLVRRGRVWAARRGVGPLLGESILHRTPEAYYRAMLGFGPPGEPDPITRCGLPRELEDAFRFRGLRTFAGLAAYSRRMELGNHLDAILTKTDLASMHHGLEVRVPLLDREVVETSLRISPRLNLRGRRPKAVLEEVFGRLVPGQPHRPDKVGFSFPYREWLRGPLRDRTREALCAPWPFELDEQAVRDTWARFDAGDGDAARAVRNLAGLRWWLERVRADVALSA